MDKQPLLEVKDLSVRFASFSSANKQVWLEAISHLSLEVFRGEVLAIAGSSGSGKSLLAHAIMGLLPHNAVTEGELILEGEPLTSKLQGKLRGSTMALIPQSVSFLDPLMQVGAQVRGTDKSKQRKKAQKEAFLQYHLEEKSEKLFPFALSGGMARRVLLCTAEVQNAELIIADEPTPGLDSQMAVQALQALRKMADNGKAVILITHDIDLAMQVADRIAVFYAGTTVETALAEDFATGREALRHPYTKALYDALPQNGFHPIAGFQPCQRELPIGCLFAPRCAQKTQECVQNIPLRSLRGGKVRCLHAT